MNSLSDLVGPAVNYYVDLIILKIESGWDQKRCCSIKRYPMA